jgi:hypothetical protein
MNKSHLLINEQALQVLPSLALAVGLEEAIVIQQLHYWLNNSKNEGRIDEDGNKWVYNTYAQWQEDNFPFWSEDKIQRVFLSLEKQGVVISAQLDAKKRDMRKFYRIAYSQLCAMDDAILRPSNTAELRDVKMNQRLPEITDNLSIENKIFADLPITQSDLDKSNLRDTAPKMFEKALGFSKPLPWWSGKEWTAFAEWVCDEYERSKMSFGEYNIWRNTPYTKGGLSNNRLRGFPNEFYDSWDMFMMSKPSNKTDETRPEYQPFPFAGQS